MADAARVCQDLGFDIVDINFGCPVNKVVRCNGGSGLLRDLPLVERLLRAVRAAITIPLTMKFRAGWNDQELVAVAAWRGWPRIAACRPSRCTRARASRATAGKADWTPHRRSESRGEDSGDRQRRHRHAGGRRAHGARDRLRRGDDRPRGISNPWIFRQIEQYLATGRYDRAHRCRTATG